MQQFNWLDLKINDDPILGEYIKRVNLERAGREAVIMIKIHYFN